jgi:hypothetical protein
MKYTKKPNLKIQVSEPQTLDPIWKQLPDDLSSLVCNKLPQVRKISDSLHNDIRDEIGKLALFANRYSHYKHKTRWQITYSMLCRSYMVSPEHVAEVQLQTGVVQMRCEWLWSTLFTSDDRDSFCNEDRSNEEFLLDLLERKYNQNASELFVMFIFSFFLSTLFSATVSVLIRDFNYGTVVVATLIIGGLGPKYMEYVNSIVSRFYRL